MTWSPPRRSLPLAACGALLFWLGLAAPGAAQDTGVVSGTVVDSTGQIVPGATVTLTNEGTASVRTATSDERGEFAFRALTPGSYTLKVELAGFRTIEQRNNVLNASSRLDLGRLTLDGGALTETVSVAASGTCVETRKR